MGLSCCKANASVYRLITNETIEQTVSIASIPRHHLHQIDDEEKQADVFTLIWLDQHSKENLLDSLRTRTLLREINSQKNCLFYDDPTSFLEDINGTHIPRKTKILLIVSGSYIQRILSNPAKITDRISIIIIFCQDSKKYQVFVGKHNVTSICTDYNSLKTCILRELPSLKLNLFPNQSLKTIQSLTTKSTPSSGLENNNIGAYFSYKLFVELLKEIPRTDQAKENMLEQCTDYYRQDSPEIERIELFRTTYTPSKAIEWYTRDAFIYKLVNRAFRTEDTALWYLFRYYITDLCEQMKVVHREQRLERTLILYRGQPFVPTKELENIRTNIGGLISTNAFFSTSQSFEQAWQFVAGATDSTDFQVVIFEIVLPAGELRNTIFVDVDAHLGRTGECEILFDLGTIFRIDSVEQQADESFWRVRMTTTDEQTTEIQQEIESMKRKFQRGNVNLLFGRLLLDMHQYGKADAYFQMMLQVLPTSHPDLASIHDYIGDLKMRTTNYYQAFTSFQQAYRLKSQRFTAKHSELGITLNHFGNYYKAIGDMSSACTYYERSLKCQNSSINIAVIKLNLSIVHMKKNSLSKARDYCFQARDILEQMEPRPHTEMIMYRAILADLLVWERNYDEAEAYYLSALELAKKFLSIGDSHRTRCIIALADLYEQRDGNSQHALKYCSEQLFLHEKYLDSDNHASIAYLLMRIGQLTGDSRSYRNALEILEKNLPQEYVATSNCQMILASYCEYDEAVQLYSIANEIQKRIYPPDHSMVLECQQKLSDLKRNPSQPRVELLCDVENPVADLIQLHLEDSSESRSIDESCRKEIPLNNLDKLSAVNRT